MYEIRIHSRGGQGGVTAARLIALAAFRDGKHATATPFYGAERRGAPIIAFARIDENPIRIYSQVRSRISWWCSTGPWSPSSMS